MRQNKPNRKRTVRFEIKATEEEATLIRERMKTCGINCMSAYMRKMAIDGYYINMDLSDIKELIFLLRNATNNLNQIAKRVNESGSFYGSDISDMQNRYETLWEETRKILAKLSAIR